MSATARHPDSDPAGLTARAITWRVLLAVMAARGCLAHGAARGMPCWSLPSTSAPVGASPRWAVCGARVGLFLRRPPKPGPPPAPPARSRQEMAAYRQAAAAERVAARDLSDRLSRTLGADPAVWADGGHDTEDEHEHHKHDEHEHDTEPGHEAEPDPHRKAEAS